MKILCIIPARKGSARIPNKNMYPLAGKPLIQYTLDIAKNCGMFDKVIVHSNDKEILNLAVENKLDFMQTPDIFAGSTHRIPELLNYTLSLLADKDYTPEFIVWLQPTSPLRTLETVERAIEQFISHLSCYDSLIPLKKISGKIGTIKNNDYLPLFGIQTNQSSKLIYQECGFIFIWKYYIIKSGNLYGDKIYPFIVDNEKEALDIDTKQDLMLAEIYLKEEGEIK